MTLILSLVTQDCAFQVADRRLKRSSDGQILPVQATKMTVWNGVLCFGFMGLAEMTKRRMPTALWLEAVLSSSSADTNDEAAHLGAEAAMAAIKETPTGRANISTAFVGVGWESTARGFEPVIYRISNCHDENGHVLSHATENFRVTRTLARPNERYLHCAVGQPVLQAELARLRRGVRLYLKTSRPKESVLRALVHLSRVSAGRNDNIGQDLLSACIPKPAQAFDEFLCMSGSPDDTAVATFQQWPAGYSDGVLHAPHFAFRGGGIANFQAGVIGECEGIRPHGRLGGLTIENGQPQLLYPCCLLFDALTQCFITVRPHEEPEDHHYLALFTDEVSAETLRTHEGAQYVRVPLKSKTELVRTLKSIRGTQRVILNPGDPEKGITFKCELGGLIHALEGERGTPTPL